MTQTLPVEIIGTDGSIGPSGSSTNPIYVTGSSGGGAVTIADGADVTQGAKADAAYAGSGSPSLVSILKGVYGALVAALPAGTNLIGKVGIDQTTPGTTNGIVVNSIGDGSDVAQGAKADSAYAGSGASSIVSILKGLYATLVGILSVQGNIASGVADSGNPVKIGGAYNATQTAVTTGQRTNLATDIYGNIKATLVGLTSAWSDGAGSSAATLQNTSNNGGLGPLLVMPFVWNGTALERPKIPNAISRLVSCAASTNSTSVKASATNLFVIRAVNKAAYDVFLKLYNKSSAPTVGTDTPFETILVPAGQPFDRAMSAPLYMGTGLAYAITKLAADSDTTAVVAGDIVTLSLEYQ